MVFQRIALLTSSLGLVASLPACADTCLDDGFGQDAPENCDANGSGSSTSGTSGTSGSGSASDTGTDTGSASGSTSTAETGSTTDNTDTDGTSSTTTTDTDTDGSTCSNGVLDDEETDVDCGGPECDACDTDDACAEPEDCMSSVCTDDVCAAPACDDAVLNGDETDVDCGGDTCDACAPGGACVEADDCASANCLADDTCGPLLTVEGAPSCSTLLAEPVTLSAMASGGTGGPYTYAWTPDDGTLATPNADTTTANPTGVVSYTVTANDGVNTASDTVTVVNADPFDLENNCTLYQGDFGGASPATITYDQGGDRACENGNNGFGLHLCEGVTFENTRLTGRLEILDAAGDDDFVGLVWGAQDASHFYSLTWKAAAGTSDDCAYPAGVVVKRVEAPDFASLGPNDLHCPEDTDNSVLLLGPDATTTTGWSDTTSYEVEIEYTDAGSTITITDEADDSVVATFPVADTTFTSGFFGSTTRSQENACVGPLFASCL